MVLLWMSQALNEHKEGLAELLRCRERLNADADGRFMQTQKLDAELQASACRR